MFDNTKKAFEKAPLLLGSHHKKDPEIEIWTKDFAAAKVAMNTIDREIRESEASISNFVHASLELYSAFVSILTCDSSVPVTHNIPDNPNAFAPLQEIVGEVESIAHTHSLKTHGYIKEIRHLMSSVEDLLKKTDHKKAECDRVAEHNQIDYDDPKAAESQQVQEFLKYHYHMLSLVPQVIKNLDRLVQLLIEKQLGYQLEVFGLVGKAIKNVAAVTNIPQANDIVEILQNWSTKIEPVVAQLAKTKTVGSFAVPPPPPHTWQRAQRVPQQVASSIPSVEQTKNFASGVGGSFKYGLSYIYPMDVKFFNPRKGMFGEITESDRETAADGKEVVETKSSMPESTGPGTPSTSNPGEVDKCTYSGSAVSTSPTSTDASQAAPVTTVIPPPAQALPEASLQSPDEANGHPGVTPTNDSLPTPTQPLHTSFKATTTAAPAQPVAREVPPRAQVTQTNTTPAQAPAPVVTAAPVAQEPPETSTTAAKENRSHITASDGSSVPVTVDVPITSTASPKAAPSSTTPEHAQLPSSQPSPTESTIQGSSTAMPTSAPAATTVPTTTHTQTTGASKLPESSNSDDELL